MSVSEAASFDSLSRAASSKGRAKMMEFSPEHGEKRRRVSVTPAGREVDNWVRGATDLQP